MSKWAPLTAFSLAQVYVAETLSSGLPVAVKVQYADLRERFDSDVATFKAILDGIEVMHPKFGFAWILDELSENMENELDFQVRPQCPGLYLQSTLGFETLDIAAALDLETATPLTDPRQYINSNLGFRNLKI